MVSPTVCFLADEEGDDKMLSYAKDCSLDDCWDYAFDMYVIVVTMPLN